MEDQAVDIADCIVVEDAIETVQAEIPCGGFVIQ